MRIIPCLDISNGRVVKGKEFKNIKDIDDPEVLAEFYQNEGADELVFYDITASKENRKMSLEFISKIASKISIPFIVGGGINNLEDIRDILEKGASKVSINSSALTNPNLIKDGSLELGSQSIVLSIDVKKINKNQWNVYSGGGRIDTGIDALEWIIEGVKLGAGEIVINSIDTDGMKEGYDLELLRKISAKVDVPIIASGGAGKLEDFSDAVLKGNADGVLAASVFHYKELTINQVKKHMKSKGIKVKI